MLQYSTVPKSYTIATFFAVFEAILTLAMFFDENGNKIQIIFSIILGLGFTARSYCAKNVYCPIFIHIFQDIIFESAPIVINLIPILSVIDPSLYDNLISFLYIIYCAAFTIRAAKTFWSLTSNFEQLTYTEFEKFYLTAHKHWYYSVLIVITNVMFFNSETSKRFIFASLVTLIHLSQTVPTLWDFIYKQRNESFVSANEIMFFYFGSAGIVVIYQVAFFTSII